MSVRDREGWKMVEEKCLQMRETEMGVVKVQFDKVKVICFHNSSYRRIRRKEKGMPFCNGPKEVKRKRVMSGD